MAPSKHAGSSTRGQGLVEYSLILLLVALAVVAFLTLFGGGVSALFTRISGSF